MDIGILQNKFTLNINKAKFGLKFFTSFTAIFSEGTEDIFLGLQYF